MYIYIYEFTEIYMKHVCAHATLINRRQLLRGKKKRDVPLSVHKAGYFTFG